MPLDQGDQQYVAQTAAKAANLAIAGHEAARHDGGAMQGLGEEPAGFLQDGLGNDSSKRLQSAIGLGAAILVAGVALALREVAVNAIAPGLVIAFLSYSLAMQGVSWGSEKDLPR